MRSKNWSRTAIRALTICFHSGDKAVPPNIVGLPGARALLEPVSARQARGWDGQGGLWQGRGA